MNFKHYLYIFFFISFNTSSKDVPRPWIIRVSTFFRSPACFEIGWPLRLYHDFFCVQSTNDGRAKNRKVQGDDVKEKSEGEEREDEEQGVSQVTELYNHICFNKLIY